MAIQAPSLGASVAAANHRCVRAPSVEGPDPGRGKGAGPPPGLRHPGQLPTATRANYGVPLAAKPARPIAWRQPGTRCGTRAISTDGGGGGRGRSRRPLRGAARRRDRGRASHSYRESGSPRRSARAPATGLRAGWRRRSAPTTHRTAMHGTPCDAGRGLCRTAAVEALAREAPGAVGRAREARGWLRHRAGRGPGAGARGGATRLDGSSTPAGAPPGKGAHRSADRVGGGGAADRGARANLRGGAVERRRALRGSHHSGWPVGAPARPSSRRGGAAALWGRTTNPWGAIGGRARLWRRPSRAWISPTWSSASFTRRPLRCPAASTTAPCSPRPLAGRGRVLRDATGRRSTDELAPRDQVTAAILDRMAADGSAHVQLDLRSIEPQRFPNVFAACRDAGLAPEREPVPVAPAAHYLMGGVVCDLRWAHLPAGGRPTRRANARARVSTGRIALRRTRSPNASSSVPARRPLRRRTGRRAGDVPVPGLALRAANPEDARGDVAPRGSPPHGPKRLQRPLTRTRIRSRGWSPSLRCPGANPADRTACSDFPLRDPDAWTEFTWCSAPIRCRADERWS